MGRVAALSWFAVFVHTRVGRDISFKAVLFFPFSAVLTFATGVDHTSYPNPVTDLVFRDIRSYSRDNSRNLVSGYERIVYRSPFPVSRMDVGMADSCIFNLN
ncbi:hypothetical protein DJ90_5865 [Paenibacillus macerans]|uniref:Uncharacterized protein n=1 Tax=Paenibacillus macerans TaxID=44252 RepID=A0A090YS62_PAEMA|nr:hypothetical protein DJ90_5865 [Paenibacillus macerans]